MSGNREAYQKHMETGHNAAWDQNWQVAIKAYTQAIREMPEDPEAHSNLGLALLRAGRLEESLKVYLRANQLAPDDPTPLEKSADVLERMGRLKDAAQQYVKVADIYLGMRDLDKAIGTWARATQLTPGLISIHAKLAQAYERIGDKRKAVREYLTLAFNFRRLNDVDKAIKAVERALRLEKNNPQALNILRALKSGGDVILPEDDEQRAAKPKPRLDEDFGFSTETPAARNAVGEADPRGPLGEAMNAALGMMAANVVEMGLMDATGASALQAMEMQRQERIPQAIEAYQRAEPRMRHPALKMNLGALLLLNNQFDEAVKHLGEVLHDPTLAPGAMHGLGIANFNLGKQKQALRFFIQSLQAVESSLAVDDKEESELQSIYDRLFTALEDTSDEAMTAVNNRFIKLLSGADWKQRVAETRRHLDEVMRTGGGGGARDFLSSGLDEVADMASRIDRAIRQGLLLLAMDEAHRAVEIAPYYLPVHIRMAEIMMREGRVRQAINKYNTVARSYLVRDETERAASILTEVLEMAPLDISVRTSLIELLENQERHAEALDHYIDLAVTYNRLGNFDQAKESYLTAEKLARRTHAPVEKVVLIKTQLADMEQMRLDTRRATKLYEEIIEIAPDNEPAFRRLVDIYFSQGNQVEGTRRLDALLNIYAKKRQVSNIVQILQELVKTYPKDSGLRSRMAGIYRQLGRNQEAIEQLDALGELQLEAGLHRDAVNTIKQIIKLKPANLNDYKKLLSQLGG